MTKIVSSEWGEVEMPGDQEKLSDLEKYPMGSFEGGKGLDEGVDGRWKLPNGVEVRFENTVTVSLAEQAEMHRQLARKLMLKTSADLIRAEVTVETYQRREPDPTVPGGYRSLKTMTHDELIAAGEGWRVAYTPSKPIVVDEPEEDTNEEQSHFTDEEIAELSKYPLYITIDRSKKED